MGRPSFAQATNTGESRPMSLTSSWLLGERMPEEERGAPLAPRVSVFRNTMRAAVKWTVGARAFDTRVIILPHGWCV